MNIQLNIAQNIKKQFDHHFKLREVNGEYYLDSDIGGGQGMVFLEFPGEMEFYHFKKSYFKIPVHMKSINPLDSGWLLLHINLSKVKQQKKIGDELIDFQKHLPIGILLYGPGLEIDTKFAPNVEMELASIHFSHTFMDTYFDNWDLIIDITKNLVYEDLDYALENALAKVLSSLGDKMICHSHVLHFMSLFLEKLSSHSRDPNNQELHTDDVKNLFVASAYLRNPLAKSVPSLQELSSIAKMGITKFKKSFKQLFGSAPMQYRNKIRMEFAREEIVARRRTPTEISYELGYAHPSNFTAAYKKYFGVLPSSEE